MGDQQTWWLDWAENIQSIQSSINACNKAHDSPELCVFCSHDDTLVSCEGICSRVLKLILNLANLSIRPWSKGGLTRIDALRNAKLLALTNGLTQHHSEERTVSAIRKDVQNQSLPIHRLPSEILLMIFDAAVDFRHVWPEDLLRVCRRWRKLVKGGNGSKLWSSIRLSYNKSDKMSCVGRLSAYLELSRQTPLTLQVSVYDDLEEAPQGLNIIQPMLRPHLQRIKTMSILLNEEGSSLGLLPISASLSSLQNLAILDFQLPEGLELSDFPIFTERLPLLKRLELDAEDLLLYENVEQLLDHLSNFSSPTHLKFSTSWLVDPGGDLRSLGGVLRHFGDLITLDLCLGDHLPDNVGNGEMEAVDFPKLRHLSIKGSDVLYILKDIHAPGLIKLSIDSLRQRRPSSDTPRGMRRILRSWFPRDKEPRFPALKIAILPFWYHQWRVIDAVRGMSCLEELELRIPLGSPPPDLTSPIQDLDALLSSRPQTRICPHFHHLHLTTPAFTAELDESFVDDIYGDLVSLRGTQTVLYQRHRTPFYVSLSETLASRAFGLRGIASIDLIIVIGDLHFDEDTDLFGKSST